MCFAAIRARRKAIHPLPAHGVTQTGPPLSSRGREHRPPLRQSQKLLRSAKAQTFSLQRDTVAYLAVSVERADCEAFLVHATPVFKDVNLGP
jgi:hypothetical protein